MASGYLDERPIWSRTALQGRIPCAAHSGLSKSLYNLTYTPSEGPWRGFYILLDYDPRAHQEAVLWQSVDVRLRNVTHPERLVVNRSLAHFKDGRDRVLSRFQNTGETEIVRADVHPDEWKALQRFRAEAELRAPPPSHQPMYQLADLMHLAGVADIVNQVTSRPHCDLHYKTGWLTAAERKAIQAKAKETAVALCEAAASGGAAS